MNYEAPLLWLVRHLDWAAGLLTLIAVQLVAMKKWQGWVLHAANGAIWGYLMYLAGYTGLVVLEIIFVVQAVWALWRWTRRDG